MTELNNYHKKLAEDIISGKDKKQIVKELIDKKIVSEDHAWEYLNDFEQKLLGGSRILGKNGGYFIELLNKYKDSPIGRRELKKLYWEKTVDAFKYNFIFVIILVINFFLFGFFNIKMKGWLSLWLIFAFVCFIFSFFWFTVCFIRWLRIRM
jgi:hypothetical protein